MPSHHDGPGQGWYDEPERPQDIPHDEEECCHEKQPGSLYRCTMRPNHLGPHVAHDTQDNPIAEWPATINRIMGIGEEE